MEGNSRTQVLVVDDKESIREAVSEMLAIEDFEVKVATNGEEAIQVMTDNNIDLVILDINMPITDGWETLRIIKDEYNGWPDTEVIMLTVHKEPENPLKAWSIGASYYLPKPFSTANLLEVVHKALD